LAHGGDHEILTTAEDLNDRTLVRIQKNGRGKWTNAQVKWIDEIGKSGRERQKQFLRYFNHLLEQAIRLRYIDAAQLHLPDNEKDLALRLNKMADVSQQKAIIEELDRAAYYIERNAHAKMLFHALTIRLYHIIADRTLVEIT